MTLGCLWQSAAVTLPRPEIDPDGLLEYSVVFTDRSLNHMSKRFVGVMQDIIDVLRTTYRAATVAVVPGGGTYAMEAVARQLATGRRWPDCCRRSSVARPKHRQTTVRPTWSASRGHRGRARAL